MIPGWVRSRLILRAAVVGVMLLPVFSCEEPAPSESPTVPAAPTPPPPEPPAAPSGLQVVASGVDFLEWSWQPVEGVSGYDVQFSTNEAFTDEDELIRRTAEQTSYRREGLPHSTTAYVRVRSAAEIGGQRITSAWSGHVGGTTLTPEPPAAPSGLQVVASGVDFLEWSWQPVEGVSGYDVQFSTNEAFTDEDELIRRTAEQTSYRREGLPHSTTAYVRVRSAAEIGGQRITSAWSGHVGGTTLTPEPLAAPSGLQVVASGVDFLEWSWHRVEGAGGYDVQFSATGAFDADVGVIPRSAGELFYRREGLASGTSGYLRVRSAVEIGRERITSVWSAHVAGMTDGPPPDTRRRPLCESVSVASITPIREVFRSGFCANYEIAFSVTTDLGDSMAFDFLRPYKVTDWDVIVLEDGIRHELKVLWQPYSKWFQWRSDVPEVRPMTILACPEGQRGPVLACSNRSCETYGSEELIPSYWHEPARGVLRAPWPYSEIRTVREGESLKVPIGYEIRKPLPVDVLVEPEYSGARGWTPGKLRRDFDFEPPIHVLKRGTTGSGVIHFALTVRANHEEQDDLIYGLRFRSRLSPGACMISVGGIRLRITD